MTKLYILGGPEKDKLYDLQGDIIGIGRSPENDIQIKDASVSRNHVKIIKRRDKFFIEDLESRNGTLVNDIQIRSGEEFEIKEGIPITIGDIVINLVKEYSMDDDDITASELSDKDLAVLDSTDLAEELNDTAGAFAKDRPMTPQKNVELVYKVASLLMQSLIMDDEDINQILEKILGNILNLLKRVDRGAFILLDTSTGEISDLIPIFKKSSGDHIKMYSQTIVDRVIREGKAVTMLDTRNEDEADLSDSIQIMRVRSVMCVPLISRSQIRGVIYVDSISKPHGFRREDLSLLTALSIPAALAIENATLHSS
jgi:adenylate cyclase